MDVATVSATVLPLLLAGAGTAATPSASLAQRLVADGFENVAVVQRGDRTQLFYEDRRYVDASDGLGRVAALLAESDATGSVELVTLVDRRPMLGTIVDPEVLRAFFGSRIGARELGETLSFDAAPPGPPEPLENLSLGHVDAQLIPGFDLSATSKAYFNLNVRAPLWPGWHLMGRAQGVVYPQFGYSLEYLTAGWHAPIAPRVDLALKMGRYRNLRDGFEFQVAGYLFDGAALWNVKNAWIFPASSQVGLHPALVGGVEVRYPWFDLFSRFGGGYYVLEDLDAYATIGRLFGVSEVEAGVFRSSVFGTQYRATLSTYLGPRVRPAPGPVRFEFPGQFDYVVRATAPPAATELSPEPDAGAIWRRLTPGYVRAHLDRWRAPLSGSVEQP